MNRNTTPTLIKLVFCLCFIMLIRISIANNPSVLNQNCLTRPIPQKFGILTTTYIRNKSTKMINDYLKRYAESDCDIYDNIYIIWNNEETPEDMGVLETSHKWKKNVYFMPTIENSLDFKYIVPTWAKQKVFFGMDDDFDITCETLKSAFSSWQKSSYGQVGPLASFYARSYVFDPQSQSFSYIDQIKLNTKWNYYHFGLTGIAFISRHFLEMYYSDIFQLKQMRKMVVEKNNCEDLLMNFMVGYLYPQLVTKYLKEPFKSLGMTGVSTTKTHTEYRAQCISHFTEILGFNPIRYVQSRKNQSSMEKKTSIGEKCLVNIKQEHFENNFISNRAYYMYIKRITGVDNDFIRSENQKLSEAKTDIKAFMRKRSEQIAKLRGEEKLQIQMQEGLDERDRKILQQTEMDIHFGSQQQIQVHMSKLAEPTIQIPDNPIDPTNQVSRHSQNDQQISALQKQVVRSSENEKLPSSEGKFVGIPIENKKQPKNQQRQSPVTSPSEQLQYQLYMIIFTSVVLCVLCVKKIIDARTRKYDTVPQSFQTEI